MAKTLQERIASARANDRTPDNQLERLIEEGRAEVDRLTAGHDQAAADSVDFALSEEDRDEAAAKADRCRREATALTNAVAALGEQLAAKRNSDSRKAAENEKAAALAERDKIAEDWAEVPAMLDRLLSIFTATEGNNERLKRLGIYEPGAEAKARGVPGFLEIAGSPESYLKVKLPCFGGPGRCWPPDKMSEIAARVMRSSSQSRLQQIASREKAEDDKRKAAEAHARAHGLYRLSTGQVADPVRLPAAITNGTALPGAVFYGEEWEGEIAHNVADQLRQVSGLHVTAIEAPKPKAPRMGPPIAMGSF